MASFNRGDKFRGKYVIGQSGSAGSPITVAAYGSGAAPELNGTALVTGWTAEAGPTATSVWRFAEASGSREDALAANNDLADTGTVTRVAGPTMANYAVPYAAQFNGSTQFLSTADGSLSAGFPAKNGVASTSFTAGCWVYLTADGGIFGKGKDIDAGWQIYATSGGLHGVVWTAGVPHDAPANTGYTPSTWTHVAMRYVDGGEVALYINGVKQSATTTAASMTSTTAALFMGSHSFWGFANARVANAFVVPTALTDAQVASIYAGDVSASGVVSPLHYHSVASEPKQVFVDDARLTAAASKAALAIGSFWYDSGASRVYIRTATDAAPSTFSGPGVEVDITDTVGVISAFGQTDLTFQNLITTKGVYGLWMFGTCSRLNVEFCEASFCQHDGMGFGATYTNVTFCVSHENGYTGFTFGGSGHHITVTGGWAYNNAPGSADDFPGGGGFGFGDNVTDCLVLGALSTGNTYGFKAYGTGTDRIVFRYCTGHGNTLFNADIDNGPHNCSIEWCEFYNGGTHQIAVETPLGGDITTGTIVRYNIVHDGPGLEGAAGIEVLGVTTNTQVYGNHCYLLENGIAGYSSPTTLLIRDNVIEQITAVGINLGFDNGSISGVTLTRNRVSTCGQYLIGTGAYTIPGLNSNRNQWRDNGTAQMNYNSVDYNLAGWKSATGQDRSVYMSPAQAMQLVDG